MERLSTSSMYPYDVSPSWGSGLSSVALFTESCPESRGSVFITQMHVNGAYSCHPSISNNQKI